MSSLSPAFSGPIDVWMVASVIDEVVKEFADEAGLEYGLRPHDEYIWYIRKHIEPDFVQQVQVAVFDRYGDGEPMMFLTPFAYVVSGNSTRTTPAGAALPCKLPLLAVLQHRTDALKKELSEAWLRAQQLKRNQISGITPV